MLLFRKLKKAKSARLLKRLLLISSLLMVVGIALIYCAHLFIENNAKGKTFNNADLIQKNSVGLVLGTSKLLGNGALNPYFDHRVNATIELYKKGKIEFVLVSGDNGNTEYDEPSDLKEELINGGIPAEKIYLDYAGFRTLDSVVRAKEIFGQNELTIISQKFHTERAIYLAEKHQIDAIGFNAQDVSRQFGYKVRMREYLARTKVFLDLGLNVQPKFLGEKITIQ